MASAKCIQIPNRASIAVAGIDKVDFLQGLLTQDISLLETQPLIYACMLTPQGKFLYDMFLRIDGDAIAIDCEGGERAAALLSTLKKYQLRKKVTLELTDDIDVFQIWDGEQTHGHIDPRHPSCGYRSYSQTGDCDIVSFNEWDTHRIQNEIPDGSRDLIPEKSFIHEGRLDDFNAVSYTKGCYVGQELISRMHHRGLTKKILKYVQIADIPDGAQLRSSCDDVGLALVRL
jgi:folate-binding protein YgfZ